MTTVPLRKFKEEIRIMQMMDWKGGRGHGSKHQALGWELSDVDGVLTHKALNGIQWYWCFQGTPAMLGSFLIQDHPNIIKLYEAFEACGLKGAGEQDDGLSPFF